MVLVVEEQMHIIIEGRILQKVRSNKYAETIIEENSEIEE